MRGLIHPPSYKTVGVDAMAQRRGRRAGHVRSLSNRQVVREVDVKLGLTAIVPTEVQLSVKGVHLVGISIVAAV